MCKVAHLRGMVLEETHRLGSRQAGSKAAFESPWNEFLPHITHDPRVGGDGSQTSTG